MCVKHLNVKYKENINESSYLENKQIHIYSVPEGVLNGGVGTTCDEAADASTGGSVKFNLFLDIFLNKLMKTLDKNLSDLLFTENYFSMFNIY